MFSVHTTQEEFKNATITHHFRFVFEEISVRDVTSSFSKSSVFKMFSVHTKTKSRRLQNSSGLKSVLVKLCFRDGLVWKAGLTVKDGIVTYT